MGKFIVQAIRGIAVIMFIFGIIFLIVCVKEAMDAGRGYYTRDTTAQTLWSIGAVQCIATVIASFLVYGFSYIVEAAQRYISKNEE